MSSESTSESDKVELQEILDADASAQRVLEDRRKFKRPMKPGYWRNMPNPFAAGSKINDDEL